MANGTKAKKLRRYYNKNPDATVRQAATYAKCSYGNAWTIKQEFSKPVVRSKDFLPTSLKIPQHSSGSNQGISTEPSVSDGSTASYYELPEGAKELQDLISYKDMNAQIGEIFRAAYRYGQSSHSDKLRDAKKIRFYIDAEIKRLGG
jgi:hypothetical protein